MNIVETRRVYKSMGCEQSTTGSDTTERHETSASRRAAPGESSNSFTRTQKNEANTQYRRGKHIGSGRYGKVHLGVHKGDGKIVALKYLDFSKYPPERLTQSVQSVLSEIGSMQNIGRHKNIVELFDSHVIGTTIVMVMEYCEGGSLRKFMKQNAPVNNIRTVISLLKDMTEGLRALRAQNLIHRDLKPENVLIDQHGTLKLADFGMARQLGDAEDATRVCGSLLYIAPEVFATKKYNPSIDLWALGCILYEIIVGDHPFMTRDVEIASFCGIMETAKINLTLIRRRRNGYGETVIQFPKLGSEFEKIVNIATWLIQECPNKRMTYAHLFEALDIEPLKNAVSDHFSVVSTNSVWVEQKSESTFTLNRKNSIEVILPQDSELEKTLDRTAITVERPTALSTLSKAASFLRTLSVNDVSLGRQHLIVMSADVTAQQAIATLFEHNISSAPVLDEAGYFCGFVDNGDLIKHLLDSMNSKTKQFLRAFVTSSSKVVNYGKSSGLVNKPVSIQNKCNLLSAILLMATGVKRLGVWSEDGEFVKVISQSSINGYLIQRVREKDIYAQARSIKAGNKERTMSTAALDAQSSSQNYSSVSDLRAGILDSFFEEFVTLTKMTLSDLNLVPQSRKMITIRFFSNVVDAFQLLVSHEISALPIVDDNGAIVSVLSTSDIALLASDQFIDAEPDLNDANLNNPDVKELKNDPARKAALQIKLAFESVKRMKMSVRDYVHLARGVSKRNPKLPKDGTIILAQKSSTLLSVMKSLHEYGIHRVFVVDAQQKPIGVVSLRDVLGALAHHRLEEVID